MKKIDIKTIQDFIDYMAPYGNQVEHKFGNDYIRKNVSLTEHDSAIGYNCVSSSGRKLFMSFYINENPATFQECLELILIWRRDKLIEDII